MLTNPVLRLSNHLLRLILTKIAPIRSIGSVWRRIRYIGVGMNLDQNSVMPQFAGSGAEGSKTKNLPLFKPIDRKSKVVWHIEKSTSPLPSQSIRRGYIGIFPLFGVEKKLFLPYLPSKLIWEVEIWYVHLVGGVDVNFEGLDFSAPFHPFTAPKVCFCALFFIFWACFSHKSPLNWTRNLKLGTVLPWDYALQR